MALTHNQLIEAVVRGMPHGDQCRDFDTSEKGALRFTWRGHKLRISESCFVEEVGDGVLMSNNLAILARAAILPTYMELGP